MNIQLVNKAVEHLISSAPVLGKEKKEKEEREIEREREREKGGGGHSHKQSEGLGGVLWVERESNA